MAAKQPRLDALMARVTELSAQIAEAAQKGDFARVETIQMEVEKVSAEYQRVWEEGGTLDRIEAASEEAGRDVEMSVVVAINSRHATAGAGASAMRLPTGAHAALRWTEDQGGLQLGHALVLFGAWRPSTQGGFEFSPRAGAAPERAQTVSVSLQADESRMDSLADTIDFAAVAGALRR